MEYIIRYYILSVLFIDYHDGPRINSAGEFLTSAGGNISRGFRCFCFTFRHHITILNTVIGTTASVALTLVTRWTLDRTETRRVTTGAIFMVGVGVLTPPFPHSAPGDSGARTGCSQV